LSRAQRAIRQRTKDHIDSLERRITELTAGNDLNARLAQALQHNEELEQETKMLRSRLNNAVSALAEGQRKYFDVSYLLFAFATTESSRACKRATSKENIVLTAKIEITPDMLTGPASPTRRLRIATRSSSVPTVPSVPRSIPAAINTMTPQDQWNQAYCSPVTSGVDRSPSLADVSPVSTNMRWGAPHHHSPMASAGDMNHHHHAIDHNGNSVQVPQHSPVAYGYMLDGSDRALSYSPAGDPSMMAPFPTPATTDSVHSGFPHHSQNQQMTPTMPSPAYAQFPGTPQSFIATSPHEAAGGDHHGQHHDLMQRTPVENSSAIYSVAPQAVQLKDE
jgi:regulator of replication initiation timing